MTQPLFWKKIKKTEEEPITILKTNEEKKWGKGKNKHFHVLYIDSDDYNHRMEVGRELKLHMDTVVPLSLEEMESITKENVRLYVRRALNHLQLKEVTEPFEFEIQFSVMLQIFEIEEKEKKTEQELYFLQEFKEENEKLILEKYEHFYRYLMNQWHENTITDDVYKYYSNAFHTLTRNIFVKQIMEKKQSEMQRLHENPTQS